MRIVYIDQHYLPAGANLGGSRSLGFAQRLAGAGHEVHMIAGACAEPGAPERGIVEHFVPTRYSNHLGYGARIKAFGQFAVGAARVAARIPHDVVFASSTPLTVAIPGIYASRRRRSPMVFEVRDVWPEVPIAMGALRSPAARWAARWLEAQAYRHSSEIVALSPTMAESIRRRFPDARVTVIPNNCDLAEFADAEQAGQRLRAQTPWLGHRPMVLYAGTIGLANGVDYVVRMAERLAAIDPEIRVVVIGDGAKRDEVRALADRLGVLDRTFFLLPAVMRKDAVAWFGACDLALSTFLNLPALSANSPNKVFDALAAGRPIAVNNGGWVAELIARHDVGLVLEPDDPAGAAKAVAAFVRDPRACGTARDAARRLARERFDRDAHCQELERILARAAGVPAAC
ncbi:glycosyltransferase family 4 protein [Phytohabitans houttuyneae]|uniref:Glycosyltransferase WbuB n=1 Tax=Phytohabitans houttuyneae TaxID=1076126 RepID=A0A6V8KGM3_9ACTN|nr:glycosyltransferase family 4 protein [Phytohabitans houttuyneae]GFJ81621.1 glycosyltransferase WbuB [Phytohabitans houttuyneae]